MVTSEIWINYCSSPTAFICTAITKYQRVGNLLETEIYFSQSRGRKFKIKTPTGLVPDVGPVTASKMASCCCILQRGEPLYPCKLEGTEGKRDKFLQSNPLIKGLNPTHEDRVLMTQ
jgi:hypothetical protein